MEKENINTEQHTFNGLNRRAMMFGIPLEAVATSIFISMGVTLPMMYFLGGHCCFYSCPCRFWPFYGQFVPMTTKP